MHFSLNHPSYQMTRLPPYASLNSPNSNCLYPHYSLLLSYHLTMASVLLLLLVVSFLPSPSLSLNQEGLYLLMARRKLDDPTNSLANWSPRDPTPCNWTGVTCNAVNSITTIDLSNLNIYGPFPPPLCLLPNLSFLSLSYNFFNSSISPSSLLPCSSVTHLDLSQNLFVGPLPSTLPSLPLLSYLDLSANNFSGDVPVSYSQFQNLKSLSLVNNLLSGPFPSLLTNLTSLQELNLSYNPFAPSELPSSLGNLTSLRMLWLAGCNLIGPIPSSIGSLSSLIDLDLSSNNLTGPIPHSLSQLSSVVQIELYSNTLTGTIPIGLSNLSSLRFFDAAMNQLTGSIPSDLFLAPKLESLHFYDNNLSGSLPPTLSQCLNLADLRLFSNRLTGPLPAGFGKSFPLVFLDLSDNYLSGEIPAGICDGGKLEQLLVLDNFFSGGIPESLGQCRTLLRVRLLNNRLSGEVPAAFWSLPHLWLLELAGNSLSGGISPMISGASNLSQLIVSDNQFTGPIPDEIGALPNLFQFSAANNRLTGPLPVSLANLGHLGQLDLHNNSLSGELLRGIQHWKKLTQFNLANNGLTGEIPEELGELPVLNYLDLSCNSLTGEIPTQLQNLKLNVFNVSDNQLSGALPPLFATGSYRNSFLGNPDLCGDPSGLCPSRHLGDPNQHRLIWVLRSILILAALVLIVGVVWFYWRYRSFEKAQPGFDKTKWTLTSFHKLGFSEYEILDCLDEDNVIGSGASGKVYKAVLSNGEAVAVKKLWAIGKKDDGRVDQSGEDSFEAEVATLGKIRHKNIVKLWCCCTHKDCKLLVYEHMPNGSLGDLLHSSKGGLLDWRMRHKIALDAAEGLSYLHHDCVPPIVHRDIKSNNILLDVDFGAKVADFGLAKVIGKGPNSMSAIAGSCGYIAPEYAYTLRVNEKSDIYSFGVVILELVTGKLPVDPEFGEKDLVKWVCSTLEQKGVEHVLDPKLNLCFRQEICKVLNIGLLCASSLPINRPSMRRVVKMLLEVAPENNPKKAKKDGKFSPYYYEDNASDNGSVV